MIDRPTTVGFQCPQPVVERLLDCQARWNATHPKAEALSLSAVASLALADGLARFAPAMERAAPP